MLHRIQPPDCVPQLEQIRQFQRDVLALACSQYIKLPLAKNVLSTKLGSKRGLWLWNKLWKQRKKRKNADAHRKQQGKREKTGFHLNLIAVIKHLQKYPHLSQSILDAFDNEVTFHSFLDDPNYHFKFNTLDKTTCDILNPLMISFYEDLLSSASGFGTVIHGQPGRLNRDDFIESFWRVNSDLEVCPACDRQRSDKVDNKIYDDADHFLPKSKYPFLSLHHANLIPLCLLCNRSFKGDRDSIDNHADAPLPNIFHPYERPALECMDVLINRNATGGHQIIFQDKSGMPSRRVKNLQRVFRLHKRWLDYLRYQINDLRDEIANSGRRIRRYTDKKKLTEQELQEELKDMLEQRRKKLGKRAGYVLQTSYLTFALQDNDEFEELLKQFSP